MCSLIENDSVNALYQKAMNGYGKTLTPDHPNLSRLAEGKKGRQTKLGKIDTPPPKSIAC